MPRSRHLSTLVILFFSFTLNAQDIQAYFAQEGLSINAYHNDSWGGNYHVSYTYYQEDSICGFEVLEFINNFTGASMYLRVEGQKVFVCFPDDCYQRLLYDYALEPGNSVPGGYYWGYSVVDKYPVTLLNGEERMRYDLSYGSSTTPSVSWIAGIGDIENALIPFFANFEGDDIFVCAKKGEELLWVNEEESELCDSISCVLPRFSYSLSVDEFELEVENNSIFASEFEWDFGDGNTSTEESPTHFYGNPGCYELSVKVSNECYTGGNQFLEHIPVCLADQWPISYSVDTFDYLYVHYISEDLEFMHELYGPNLHRTTDGGQTWTKIDLPPVPNGVQRLIRDIKMFDDQNGVMICGHYGAESDQKAILVTHDGGFSWEEKVPYSYFIHRLTVGEDGRAWALGGPANYYRTFDYGDTWEQISYPYLFSIPFIQYKHDSLLIGRGNVGVQPGGESYLIKSYDDGLNWDTISIPDNLINWTFFDETTAYARTVGQGVAKTSDGGYTWTDIPLDFNVRYFTFYSDAVGWLVDDKGLIHYTTDGMQTFSVSFCNPESIDAIQVISETEAYIVTSLKLGANGVSDHKRIFDLNAVPPECEVIDPVEEISMEKIYVYPNPVTSMLTIEMEVPEATISLLDVLGKIILQKTFKEQNRMELDLADVPVGLYLLQIRDQNDRVFTKKVVKN